MRRGASGLPDPFVMRRDGMLHGHATQSSTDGRQVMDSADLVHRADRGACVKPAWSLLPGLLPRPRELRSRHDVSSKAYQ